MFLQHQQILGNTIYLYWVKKEQMMYLTSWDLINYITREICFHALVIWFLSIIIFKKEKVVMKVKSSHSDQ